MPVAYQGVNRFSNAVALLVAGRVLLLRQIADAFIEPGFVTGSLSAVSEAPTSGKVSAEVLWTALQIQRLEGSRPGDYGICIWMSRS